MGACSTWLLSVPAWRLATGGTEQRSRHRSRTPCRLSAPEKVQAVQHGSIEFFRPVFRIANQEERMAMCPKLNDLRRERWVPSMASSSCPCPVATTDATKWKSVLLFLDQCLEKPRSAQHQKPWSRHLLGSKMPQQ